MLRHSMSVAQGSTWGVLAGAAEYDGLGANRLTTKVTKTRLRLFQSLTVSRFASENELSLAMVCLAQRWCGASTPVNMLHSKDLRLLLPLNDEAPQAAHMFHELRSLGYSLAAGWRCEPMADGDATVYGARQVGAGSYAREGGGRRGGGGAAVTPVPPSLPRGVIRLGTWGSSGHVATTRQREAQF